ncbi:MAG: hypothetical protein AUI01_03750 [Ktedonobacter sp. 13_2_20CM_2_56_8]|nr:MAG: hypothetical protein AUH05_19285 [Ktedonobacter sp. 13_2_20CM_53_11]OLB57821.1 MAG: hypothetical protein AUI01_03750 [Ktedonobacter sp. 13_2_20CM_2_56_8]
MTEKANHLEQELQRRGKAELDLATDRSANGLESLVFFGTPRFTPSGKEPYTGWVGALIVEKIWKHSLSAADKLWV